jgi:hypothetical protein
VRVIKAGGQEVQVPFFGLAGWVHYIIDSTSSIRNLISFLEQYTISDGNSVINKVVQLIKVNNFDIDHCFM